MKLLRPLAAAVVAAALMVSPAHAATKPPKPTATIVVPTTTPAEGASIPVTGTVSQVPAGTLVTFQHSFGGSGWVADKSLTVDAAGHYSTSYRAVLGPNKIRTYLPPQGSRRAATSPVITVTGPLGITPTAPTTTDQVRVEATLPTPVARTVQLQTSEASGWVTRTTGVSASSGRFALTATFAASLTIRVVAPKVTSQGKRLYVEFDSPSLRVDVAPPSGLTPTPTVVGTAALGETLTVVTGTWDPGVVLTYQWLRSGVGIPSETGVSHVVTAADVGAQLAVRVTGTKPGVSPVARTSALTSVVAPGALQAANPVVLGTPQQFAVLTADPGQWGPAPVDFAYQWLRDDAPIDGATQAAYTLSDQDAGSLLQVRVTGSKPGYTAETTTSERVIVPGPQSASKVARALRTFHTALQNADQDPVDIFAGPSDSLTEGFAATSVDKRWTNVLADDLRTSYEPAGVAGGLGYADPINFGAFPDYPISFVRGIGNFTIGLGREGLALFDPDSQSITVDDTYSDLDIYYTGRSDGSYGWFNYTVDGGAPITVHTGDKSVSRGGYVAKISDLGLGHHVVVIRVSPGHGPAMIEGVMLYSGDRSSGVRMWEGGHNGLTAADYVAPNAGWADSLAEVHPDLVVLPIGSNDFALGTSAADTRTRIEEIIRTIRSHVDTNPSIVLLSYYNRPTTGSAPWSTYQDMYKSIAAADPDVCVFDLDPLLGPYKTDTRSTLMSADWLHPSDAGYALIGNALADFLTAP